MAFHSALTRGLVTRPLSVRFQVVFGRKNLGRYMKKVERSTGAVGAALGQAKENVHKKISKMVDEVTKRTEQLGDDLSRTKPRNPLHCDMTEGGGSRSSAVSDRFGA